jgi:hypothetical protein
MRKLLLLFALLLSSSAVRAQTSGLAAYNGYVQPAGYPFGPPFIAVCASGGSGGPPCAPLTIIYSDLSGTQQLPNPFQINPNGNGNYTFYGTCATPYVVQSYGAGYTTTLTSVALPSCSGGGGGGVTGNPSRLQTFGGTLLTSGDFSLGACWGTGASISGIIGTDTAFTFTITAGTSPCNQPTVTMTYHNGPWLVVNAVTASVVSNATGQVSDVGLSPLATSLSALTLTYLNFPVAAQTYTFSVIVTGNSNITIAAPLNTVPFSGITTSTNTSAAMTCNTPCSIAGTGVSGGTSASLNAVGPVINVTNSAYGASPSLANNSTAFAAVAAAATAASTVSFGTPTIRAVTHTVNVAGTSFNIPVTVVAGDTVLVFVSGVFPTHTTSVSDGTNVYAPISSTLTVAGDTFVTLQIWSTAVASGVAFTGNITVTDGSGGDTIGGFAMVAYNIGSIGQQNSNGTSGNSTAPSANLTIADANNLVVSGSAWSAGGTTSIAANVGTVQDSFASTGSTQGGAIITNTSATPGTNLTTSGTLSASVHWVIESVELRSVRNVIPTVYFPAGVYNYTSGLSFPNPVTLQGGPGGAWLCYEGSAHAIDFGPKQTQFPGSQAYTVQGMSFTCGSLMTEGIYVNTFIITTRFIGNEFNNFGNVNAYMIYLAGDNYDDVITQNNFILGDNIPRNGVALKSGDGNGQMHFFGNRMSCFGCTLSNTATTNNIGLDIQGNGSQIFGNDIEFWSPSIWIDNGAVNIKVFSNYLENSAAANTMPVIQFTGTPNTGMIIENNFAVVHALNAFIAPSDASQTLSNARIRDNYLITNPVGNPVVVLNNLAGQTGNQASGNYCSVGGDSGECDKLHTTGGNVSRWNADLSPVLTFTGTLNQAISYTFLTTYSTAPNCVITPVNPAANTFTITTLSTTTLTVTVAGTFSGTVNAHCDVNAY